MKLNASVFSSLTGAVLLFNIHRVINNLSLTGLSQTKMEDNLKNEVIVVSGLPRSGTSLMMQILEKAGLEILVDQTRPADMDNPRGYYEYEPVKYLKDGDRSWIQQAKGKGIKIISHLLFFLPPQYKYKIVFMRRKLSEIVASQNAMLQHLGKEETKSISEADLIGVFSKHLHDVTGWLAGQENVRTIFVDYNELIKYPAESLVPVERFLALPLVSPEILKVVDPSSYRQRD